MAERQEHQPGTHAPLTGHYEELNIFGTRLGRWSMCVKESDCRTRHEASVGGRWRRPDTCMSRRDIRAAWAAAMPDEVAALSAIIELKRKARSDY